MGSLGDGDDKNKTVDLSDTETQTFDSQFPPESLSGGEFTDEDIDKLQSLHGTVPFDDALPLEDDFETQLVNLGGETQVLNLGGETQVVSLVDETQVVNLGGETQVLDYLDCIENNGTQLINDCDTEVIVDTDDEGSVRTEVLCDTEEVSEDSFLKNVGGLFQTETRALSNEGCRSGFAPRGFTSLRAASVRAAGLAARNTDFRATNSGSCSTTSVSQSLKKHGTDPDMTPAMGELSKSTEEIDQGNTTGEYVEQMKGIRNKNKCRAGRSAVRKLFTEDDKLDETKGLVEESENGLVGLSYVDSQEPGEASQANALDFVDRFLKVNVEEFNQEVELRKSVRGKSTLVSSAKGTQILAKSANLLSSAGERSAFDWDDTREDEGGGEFFRKKKEVLFDNGNQQRRSFRQKPGCFSSKSGGAGEETRKGDDESKKSSGAKFGKKLIKEFDEECNMGPNDGAVETGSGADMPDMMNVGLDTQMAAEAMEALCYGVGGGPEVDYDDTNQGPKNMQKDSHKEEARKIATKVSKESSKSSTRSSVKVRKQLKKANSTNGTENLSKVASVATEKIKGRKSETVKINDVDDSITCQVTISSGQTPVKKRRMQGQQGNFTPVARRTRQCMGANQAKGCGDTLSQLREGKNRRKRIRTGVDALAKDTSSDVNAHQHEESEPKLSATRDAVEVDLPEYPKRKRTTHQRVQEPNGKAVAGSKRSNTDTVSVSVDVVIKRRTRSSVNLKSVNINGSPIAKDVEASPRKPCDSACTTPVNCVTPINEASPICMGDEYLKQSCRKNLTKVALIKELNSLISRGKEPDTPIKDSRRRRDMASVKVVFSRHLDGEIIKHQKKILARLGASVASSMSDATHFIADEFVRTRNMLEAIAFGKPVVTNLWLESCGQANCLIDERNYILRDAKKEKEFGFSLPVSLARACKHPLLQGQRVFITPNTKPGKDIVASLVKAVHGLAVERIGRSKLKDDKIPDDLLVLSCEEDYEVCVPFLAKGAEVYSSELLLNGIVTQKLEYERHRLFSDHVKKTRSTIWVRKDSNQFQPVARCK